MIRAYEAKPFGTFYADVDGLTANDVVVEGAELDSTGGVTVSFHLTPEYLGALADYAKGKYNSPAQGRSYFKGSTVVKPGQNYAKRKAVAIMARVGITGTAESLLADANLYDEARNVVMGAAGARAIELMGNRNVHATSRVQELSGQAASVFPKEAFKAVRERLAAEDAKVQAAKQARDVVRDELQKEAAEELAKHVESLGLPPGLIDVEAIRTAKRVRQMFDN